ncbi:SIP domain-containing protein [Herbiconiux moechotypicola]|uniref:SIP-like Rossmann fold domain-containing protein n=1 Tax=Herbiconiux moechotypicola TaxID=637393 RepID=A0ABP5Q5C8_9MICO|nr:SIP domain-containing protein [Herbiconiux moechotypicola]MCS5728409.1 SIP domain-containing protein [Herbiconiux moechotypicola]
MYVIASESAALAQATGRVLLAGTENDLDEMRAIIATLGDRARGQVFVEVPSAADIDPIATPERVTVTWLARDVRTGEMGSGLACAPGQALGRAVSAWVGEMSTGEDVFDGDGLCAWVGRSVPAAYLDRAV